MRDFQVINGDARGEEAEGRQGIRKADLGLDDVAGTDVLVKAGMFDTHQHALRGTASMRTRRGAHEHGDGLSAAFDDLQEIQPLSVDEPRARCSAVGGNVQQGLDQQRGWLMASEVRWGWIGIHVQVTNPPFTPSTCPVM